MAENDIDNIMYDKLNIEQVPLPAISNYLPEGAPDLSTTEVGNSKRLIRLHGDKIRFSYAQNAWLIYDRRRWRRDERNQIVELAKETAASIYSEAALCKDEQRRRMLGAHAMSTESRGKLSAMVSLAESDEAVAISESELDADPMLLNVANGTVNLHNGELIPHSPKHLLTKLSDVEFDANAKCPRWDQFIREVTAGDEDLQRYLAQVVGYCLTGRTDEQAFFIMVGGGANGKSVFLNVVQRLLGEYGDTTDFNTFTERKSDGPRADLAKLKGCRLALCSETGPGDRVNESVVKQVTGGDRITARFLYGNYFTYDPQFKIVLATNHLPTIVGTGHGIWRRVQAIPFNVTFTKDRQDKDLINKLIAELPGILNWAIEGCLSWQKHRGLAVPKCVEAARQAYREEMDTVHAFLNYECVIDPKTSVVFSGFYAAYEAWCEQNGYTPVSKTLMGRRLKDDYGLDKDKGGRGQAIRKGVRLMTPVEKEEATRAAESVAEEPFSIVAESEEWDRVVEREWDPFALLQKKIPYKGIDELYGEPIPVD